jgi:hypothetical protein
LQCALSMSIRGCRLASALESTSARCIDTEPIICKLFSRFLDFLQCFSLGGQRATNRRLFPVFLRVCVVTPQTCCISGSAPGCAHVVCDTSTDIRHSSDAAAIGRRSPLPRRHVENNAPSCQPAVRYFVRTDGNFKHALDHASFSGFH